VVGLTRSDSTTLPRAEHSFGAAYNDDRFSIGPDAPPIPSNASFLYEPPKKPRTAAAELREKRKQNLRRRSSTGSLAARTLPETPTPSTRPSSALLSPGVEFDIASLLPKSPESQKSPPFPRSPLPPTPKLAYLQEDDSSSKRESGPDEYQEATQRFPVDSQLVSPDLDMLSPTVSSEDPHSAKNLEDVLNYYSLPDSPALLLTNGNYRPAFSPISEESSSQLSPPTPYRSDKRESQRNIPIGARSPLSGTPRGMTLALPSKNHDILTLVFLFLLARGDSVLLPRRPSDGRQSRPPPGERPNSITQPPSPSVARSSSSFGSVGSDLLSPLTPPQLSTIFNRQRSGSAPSPIKVVRDSRDANAYKITVTPRLSDPDTPSTDGGLDGGGNVVSQEFPETPNMFSPMFTGSTTGSSSMGQESMEGSGRLDASPMPTTPVSATVSRVTSQPSLAQQILLNRAGTTVRHSRQASISKIKTNGLGGRSGSPSNRRLLDIGSPVNTANVEPASSSSMNSNVPQDPVPELSVTSAEHAPTGDLSQSPVEHTAGGPINGGMSAVDLSRPPSRGTIMTQGSDASSMYASSSERRMKSLPSIPVSPSTPGSLGSVSGSPVPPPVVVASITGVASQNHPSTTPASTPSPAIPTINETPDIPPPPTIPPPSPTPSQKARALPLRGRLPPALTITSSVAASTVAVNGDSHGENSPASLGEPSTSTGSSVADGNPNGNLNVSQNANATVPNQTSSLTYEDDFTGRASDIFRGTSLGSPPPYYSVVSEAIAQTEHNATNHTPPLEPRTPQANGAVALESFQFSGQLTGDSPSTTPGPTQLEWSQSSGFRAASLLARESSAMSQRSRMRPPLPAGPRRPSQVSTIGSISGSFAHQRDRAGSVSSINSNHFIQVARRGREPESVVSPKFQTPSPKWRGYTMEIAKWTFTSAQLQAIVSKAIQQSAQASSIRLLRLEVLENDLPEEMRRLEAQRTELKTRYKMLTRRRATVLDALSSHISDWDGESPTYALRLVESLKEIGAMLDQVAEELHSVDGQLAHLDSMTHIHTGSALSMALRKLNASFLKQVAENQSLIKKIQTLEAERDEGWRQAESEANEFDRMSDRDRADGPSSKRSSRVSAKRKSSARVSKAGLRTPSQRFSQASSLGSSGIHSYSMTPARSPLLRLEEIPPVPPIPRRRPLDIRTPSPLRSSSVRSFLYLITIVFIDL